MGLEDKVVSSLINTLCRNIHQDNVRWWIDPATQVRKQRNVGEMLALVHSEISEALEAYRKNLKDDKLTHREGIEVELADAVIRIFDMAGGMGMDLGGALVEKLEYNRKREDHTDKARLAENGKKF